MERQGNSKLTLKKVCRALLIMLTGILACAIFAVAVYLTYEVVVGHRDYCTLWTDIPGRLFAFAICYYVAGVCGCLPIPEGWRPSWLPGPFFVLWRAQSWWNFFLSPLSYMMNRVLRRRGMDTSETPLLHNRNEEQCYDRSPGASAVLDRRFPCGTPANNLHAESSASPLPQDGEFRDFPPATPGPSRAAVIWEQDAPGGRRSVHSFNSPMAAQRNRSEDQLDIPKHAPFNLPCEDVRGRTPNRTSDISQSSESFMSFDSPVGGQIVPMAKGKSNKPPYIPYSSISDSSIENSESSAAELADDEQDNTEYQDSPAASGRDTVVLVPANETGNPSRTHDEVVRLPDYPRIPWKWISPSGRVPYMAAKVHNRNLLEEKREIEKQIQGSRKKAMENSQLGATSSAKESDGERSTGNDHSDPPEIRYVGIPRWPSKITCGRGRSRTTPRNFRGRRQFVPVHNRCVSHRSLQSSEPKMHIEASRLDDMKCCENMPNHQELLDRLKKFCNEWQRKFKVAAEASETRQNVGSELEASADKNSDLPGVPGSSAEIHQTNKPDVKISLTAFQECPDKNLNLSGLPGSSTEIQQADKPDIEISLKEFDKRTDENSHLPGVSESSTEIQQANKPDNEISSTEFDKPTDENSDLSGVPGGSTEMHRTDKPDDDISLTEFDESESRRNSDPS